MCSWWFLLGYYPSHALSSKRYESCSLIYGSFHSARLSFQFSFDRPQMCTLNFRYSQKFVSWTSSVIDTNFFQTDLLYFFVCWCAVWVFSSFQFLQPTFSPLDGTKPYTRHLITFLLDYLVPVELTCDWVFIYNYFIYLFFLFFVKNLDKMSYWS